MRQPEITRRSFMQGIAVGSAGLALGIARLAPVPGRAVAGVFDAVSYGDWRDVYRQAWKWDRVVRSTHLVNCWYQANCSWRATPTATPESTSPRSRSGASSARHPQQTLGVAAQ